MSDFYVTFGQLYSGNGENDHYPKAHRDGWVRFSVPDCFSVDQAQGLAHAAALERLGSQWSGMYSEGNWDASYFPLGELDNFVLDEASNET